MQVYSGLFIAINLYALLNACLEAKLLAPAADDVQRGALATRIAGRYACFVYQCMYLSWAFDANEVLPRSPCEKFGKDECLLVVAVRLVVADPDVHLCDRGLLTAVAAGTHVDL